MIRHRIAAIRENIHRICKECGRDPSGIVLVAVTKYTSVEKMREAVEGGITHLAENYIQEAQEKFEAFGAVAMRLTKHMIGHLQSNKARFAVPLFDMIQSVDSFKLAKEVNTQAIRHGKVMDILIEVNCSGERQKFGIEKGLADGLLDQIGDLTNIRTMGFMTMAPFVDDEKILRETFSSLRMLKDGLERKFAGHERMDLRYLSMGMTNDYETALREGANMLRIGAGIFA